MKQLKLYASPAGGARITRIGKTQLTRHGHSCTLGKFITPFETIMGSIDHLHRGPKFPRHPTGHSETTPSLVGPQTTHDPSIHSRYRSSRHDSLTRFPYPCDTSSLLYSLRTRSTNGTWCRSGNALSGIPSNTPSYPLHLRYPQYSQDRSSDSAPCTQSKLVCLRRFPLCCASS